MKVVCILIAFIASISVFANEDLYCVDINSFKPLRISNQVGLSCSEINSSIRDKLVESSKQAIFSSHLNNRYLSYNGVVLIDGEEIDLSEELEIDAIETEGPTVSYFSGTRNYETVLEVEYDSDMSAVAPYGATLYIGELIEVEMICYDLSRIHQMFGCDL